MNDAQQYKFFWTKINGKAYAKKVGVEMLSAFYKPNDGPAPNVLAEHELKDHEHELSLEALMLLHPWPKKLEIKNAS